MKYLATVGLVGSDERYQFWFDAAISPRADFRLALAALIRDEEIGERGWVVATNGDSVLLQVHNVNRIYSVTEADILE